MISQELQSQLKSAGFPIKTKQGCANCWGDLHEGCDKDCGAELPIGLSELIEACGDIILFKLPKNNRWGSEFNGLWVASRSTYDDYLCASDIFIDTYFPDGGITGSTPEEAVANLWLELNEKT